MDPRRRVLDPARRAWRLPARARAVAGLAAAAGTLLAAAAPANGAAVGRGPRPRANFDVRLASRPAVPSHAKAAREALRRSLGRGGMASTDPATGGLRLVARPAGLTGPTRRRAEDVALDYVRGHAAAFGLDGDDLAALRLIQRVRSPLGITHLAWVQTAAGIPAYDNVLFANLASDGRLINAGGAASDVSLASTAPKLSAGEALAAAAASAGAPLVAPRASGGGGPERATRFSNGGTAQLTLFNDGKRTRLAWRVQVWGPSSFLYEVLVDAASGSVLLRRSLTDFASNASVFDNYPGASAGGTAHTVDLAAPDGGRWLNRSNGFTVLQGNNAHAYADVNANNIGDAGEEAPPSSGTDWVYPQTPFDVSGQACPIVAGQRQCSWRSTDPSTKATNQRQATTQLFYFVNAFHDHLKAAPIGFDQAHRNFEFANDGSGQGVAGDPVIAEANDGSGTNNANFSTPGDGSSPRMQMFFFTNPSVNTDDEADIVYHEYTHGLSNRSVGTGIGISANQTSAMGEGWSDWYAMDFLVAQGLAPDTAAPGEVKVGGFVSPAGSFGVPGTFRREGMDCPVGPASSACPGSANAGGGGFTLGDMGHVGSGFEVHNDGEIWAQTLWDLREALGSSVAEALITDGMRMGPNNPSFLEARDGIIQADQATGGAHYSQLWQVFARRGMGYSASTGSSAATTATEAFDVPPLVVHQATGISDAGPNGDGDGAAEPGEAVTLTEALANPNPFSLSGVNALLDSSTSGVVVGRRASAYPTITGRGSASNTTPFAVTIPPGHTCGTPVALQLQVSSAQGPQTVNVTLPTGGGSLDSSDVPKAIPDGDATGVTSDLAIGGSGTLTDVNVRIGSITHTWDGDLTISIIAPDGTTVVLAARRGSNGDDFTNTVFDDDAGTAIASGSAPFTGSFRPDSPLSALNGHQVGGTWKLKVVDSVLSDVGTLRQWGLTRSPSDCSTPGVPPLPSAGTGGASGVTTTSAALNGSFDGNGTSTDFAFQLGTTTAYGTSVAAGSGTGSAQASGAASGLAPATQYHFRAVALRGGVPVAAGADQTFTTASGPPAPIIASPANASFNNTGNVTVSGTAPANSTVEVYDSAASVGTATVDGGGSWSKSLTGVADGPHTYTATATVPGAGTSPPSNPRTVTVDTHAPSPPVIASPADGSSNDTGTVTVSGLAEAGSTVEVFDGPASQGTTTADGGGSWSRTLTGVGDGVHGYTARATDAAGNTSAPSAARTVTVARASHDATPTGPGSPPPSGPSTTPSGPPFAGTASFTSSPKTVTASAAGSFSFTFKASPLLAGSALFETDQAVVARVRPRRRRLTLGRRPFVAGATGAVTVVVKLSSANLRTLRKHKRLTVRVTVTVDGRSFVSRFRLNAPKPKRRRR